MVKTSHKKVLLVVGIFVVGGALLFADYRERPPADVSPAGKGFDSATHAPVNKTGARLSEPAPIAPQSSGVLGGVDLRQPGPNALKATSFLPPPDTRLREAYPQLVSQVASGNLTAACRLAQELNRCRLRPKLIRDIGRRTAEMQKLPAGNAEREAVQNAVARAEAKIKEEAAFCADFTDDAKVPAWQYLYWAAAQGHLPSMVLFAIAPPLDFEDFGEDFEGWQAYRESAGFFLQRAADAGHPRAAVLIAVEYLGHMPPLGGIRLVNKDPAVAARYLFAAQSLPEHRNNRAIERLLASASESLSPEQMQTARTEAHALVSNWMKVRSESGLSPPLEPPSNGTKCSE